MLKRMMILPAVAALALSACSMTTPSRMTVNEMRVIEETKTMPLAAAKPDAGQVNIIASDISANAQGEVSLVMPYPAGNPAAEMTARRQGEKYKTAFAKEGVKNIKVDYVAVEDRRLADQAVISYRALRAAPPADCTRLIGQYGAERIEDNDNYQVGCETKTVFSKMVARPADMLGREGVPDGTSRRQGTIIEDYSAGKPNDSLDGMTASTVGAGG